MDDNQPKSSTNNLNFYCELDLFDASSRSMPSVAKTDSKTQSSKKRSVSSTATTTVSNEQENQVSVSQMSSTLEKHKRYSVPYYQMKKINNSKSVSKSTEPYKKSPRNHSYQQDLKGNLTVSSSSSSSSTRSTNKKDLNNKYMKQSNGRHHSTMERRSRPYEKNYHR